MSIRIFRKKTFLKNPVLKKRNSAVPIAEHLFIIPIPNVNIAEAGFKKTERKFL